MLPRRKKSQTDAILDRRGGIRVEDRVLGQELIIIKSARARFKP